MINKCPDYCFEEKQQFYIIGDMIVNKCPDCGFEDIESTDTFCPRCGLVFDDSPIYDNKNTGTYHEPLDDGQDLEMEMIKIERKYGYRSRAYKRFDNFKDRYYNIFEEVLLENGYQLYEVPHMFYNHFKQWYHLNSKGKGNPNCVDLIEQFLREFEV